MLPIRDYNPTRRPSLLTWGLILINFGVYFYLAQNPVMDENAIARYSVIPADITAGRHLGTLITSMFLHANLLHVGGFVTGLILAILLRPREYAEPHPGYG